MLLDRPGVRPPSKISRGEHIWHEVSPLSALARNSIISLSPRNYEFMLQALYRQQTPATSSWLSLYSRQFPDIEEGMKTHRGPNYAREIWDYYCIYGSGEKTLSKMSGPISEYFDGRWGCFFPTILVPADSVFRSWEQSHLLWHRSMSGVANVFESGRATKKTTG